MNRRDLIKAGVSTITTGAALGSTAQSAQSGVSAALNNPTLVAPRTESVSGVFRSTNVTADKMRRITKFANSEFNVNNLASRELDLVKEIIIKKAEGGLYEFHLWISPSKNHDVNCQVASITAESLRKSGFIVTRDTGYENGISISWEAL